MGQRQGLLTPAVLESSSTGALGLQAEAFVESHGATGFLPGFRPRYPQTPPPERAPAECAGAQPSGSPLSRPPLQAASMPTRAAATGSPRPRRCSSRWSGCHCAGGACTAWARACTTSAIPASLTPPCSA